MLNWLVLLIQGTTLFFKPGLLAGGTIDHECNPQRSIGYFLEAVVCLAPFCKKPIRMTLRGVTNDAFDPSVGLVTISCDAKLLFVLTRHYIYVSEHFILYIQFLFNIYFFKLKHYLAKLGTTWGVVHGWGIYLRKSLCVNNYISFFAEFKSF